MKTLIKNTVVLGAISLIMANPAHAVETSVIDLRKQIDAITPTVREIQETITKAQKPIQQIVAQVNDIVRVAELEQAITAQAVAGEAQVQVLAQAAPELPLEDVLSRTYTLKDRPGFLSPERRAGQALVISAKPIEPGTMSAMEEDLTVMSHLLYKEIDRELGPDKPESAMGIWITPYGGSRTPEAVYLDGYGALFMLNVRFPLMAPPAKDEPKREPPGDSSWEKAKQELYGSRERSGDEFFRVDGRGPVEYDAERVENLKKALFNVLKNANNIRNLPSDESVIITVFGSANAPGAFVYSKAITGMPAPGGPVSAVPGKPERPATTARLAQVHSRASSGDSRGGSAGRGTVMTIRVKKSDIDAFAKGRMDLDEFRQKAALNVYWGSANKSARAFFEMGPVVR